MSYEEKICLCLFCFNTSSSHTCQPCESYFFAVRNKSCQVCPNPIDRIGILCRNCEENIDKCGFHNVNSICDDFTEYQFCTFCRICIKKIRQ